MIEWAWFNNAFDRISVMVATLDGAFVQQAVPGEVVEFMESDHAWAAGILESMAESMEHTLREFINDPVARDAML